MDLQMPEMDGYQATAKLRSDARFAALPIIAMTAHATIEERQRCLAAGMNDHISKPIDPDNLFETVGRYYKPAVAGVIDPGYNSTVKPQQTQTDELPTITGLDTKDGLSRVAGNRKLYLKLLRQFIEQQGPAPEQIAAALSSNDITLAERIAHTLKGVAGNIGAKPVQAAAGILEKAIRDRVEPAAVEAAKQQVAEALDPLVAEMHAALDSLTPEPAIQAAEPATATPAQTREAAAELARLLAECDPSAADFIEANQPAMRALFASEALAEFQTHVQNYAFADAEAQLAQARANMK
jgi:CheY-like chemotaxis protein